MNLSTFEHKLESYQNKYTIIYGAAGTGKTTCMNDILKLFPIDTKIMHFSESTAAEIEKVVKDRWINYTEEENIKYCNKVLEILYDCDDASDALIKINNLDLSKYYNWDDISIERFLNRKNKSLERLTSLSPVYNSPIVIVYDDYYQSSSVWNNILLQSRCNNITIIVTTQTSKNLSPSMRSMFDNSLFYDKQNISSYVFSLSNLCDRSVRANAEQLMNNDVSRIALVKGVDKLKLLV